MTSDVSIAGVPKLGSARPLRDERGTIDGQAQLASNPRVRLFGRKREAEQAQAAEVYTDLREQVLRLRPDQLEDGSFDDAEVIALLMETGYPEAVATLVVVADGTSSLYFSNGGGLIGAGTHAPVADASRRLLQRGHEFLPHLSSVTDPPLPAEGLTQFVAVTRKGLRGAGAPEAELGEGEHPLSPLFYAGHDVITQIRLVEGG
jgi:hypothetical protein